MSYCFILRGKVNTVGLASSHVVSTLLQPTMTSRHKLEGKPESGTNHHHSRTVGDRLSRARTTEDVVTAYSVPIPACQQKDEDKDLLCRDKIR